jgi:hypothetical protein
MPEPRELDPMAAGLIKANLTSDEFATDRILTRAVEADLDGLFSAFTMTNWDGFAAFAKGDFAVLTDLFAEDLLWHDSGRNQLSGDYRGRDAVFGLFGKLMEVTEGSLRIDLRALFADDERGVALVVLTASRGGRSVEVREAHVFHMRDGKVVASRVQASAAGLFVPKPTREEMYQLLTVADLPCTVRRRPSTSAGVSRRCYSVGYSPAQGAASF